MQPPAAAAGDCPAESPAFPHLRVDTDDPARLRITHTTRDQQRKPGPLITLRRPARPSATRHRNPRTARVLRRSPESAEPVDDALDDWLAHGLDGLSARTVAV
jgi:hypothetical protein